MLNDYPTTIFFTDEELADTRRINVKVISKIVQRELGLGRQLPTITDAELATRTATNKKTANATMQKLGYPKKRPQQAGYVLKIKQPNEPPSELPAIDGICLTDAELADPALSLNAKVILKLIEREVRFKKTGDMMMTNAEWGKRIGTSGTTAMRALHELEKEKLIGLVHDNYKPNLKKLTDPHITTKRYIYLDRWKAGRRKAKISKAKRNSRPAGRYYYDPSGGFTEAECNAMAQESAKEIAQAKASLHLLDEDETAYLKRTKHQGAKKRRKKPVDGDADLFTDDKGG